MGFEWTPDYSVNIKKIDEQHIKIFNYCQEILDGISRGEGNEVVGDILANLVHYTITHLTYEEDLMQKNGFSDFEWHKSLHDNFRDKIYQLNEEYRLGMYMVAPKLASFLRSWLADHIMKVDKAYKTFLNSKGVF